MKRYPQYKDSGVQWLGDIPEHWEVIKIKRLSQVKRGASPRPIDSPKYFDDNGEFAWVRIADVTASSKYLLKTTQTLSQLGSSLSVKQYPGDFFVSIAASVGKPIITKIKCCIHDGFVYFTKFKINHDFIYYLFEAQQLFKGLGKLGTQLNLNTDTIGNIQIPFPPISEQKNIACFLDRKLEEIDKFISNKQRLIELLKEQKTAIINRAVTKGLNPDAPMKPSGIEWLGDIPKNWNISKIGYVCNVSSGGTPDRSRQEYWNGKIPWIKTGEINFNQIQAAEEYITEEGLINSAAKVMPPGTLLMAMYGQGVTRGRVAILGIEAAFNQACLAISPYNSLDISYLFYFFIACYQFIRDTGNETSQMNLSAGLIKTVKVILPPLQQQSKIVAYVNKYNIQINQAITTIEKEIELIKEYRTTLISEAVTGKIDVRET